MASITLTNVTSPMVPVPIREFYTSVPAVFPFTLTTTRNPSEISSMAGLLAAVDAGQVTMSITYTADEIANGVIAPQSGPLMQSPVTAATVDSQVSVLRIPLAAGTGGTADDVTAYAVNTVPFKFRVLDGWAVISTNEGGSTCNVYTQASAGGTEVLGLSSASAGRVAGTLPSNVTAVVTPASSTGIFVHRSNNLVVGEVFLLIRREI